MPKPAKQKSRPPKIPRSLAAKFARVKLLLCDVDGVLTDASVFMGNGMELKRFHIQDGLGMRLLQHSGVKVGWISARPSQATEQRAKDLKIDFLHQDQGSKVAAAQTILDSCGVGWDEVCFMGDDVVDLAMLKRAGVGVGLPNGIEETKQVADYVTRREGGHGAVREVVDLILKAQGKWAGVIEKFMNH